LKYLPQYTHHPCRSPVCGVPLPCGTFDLYVRSEPCHGRIDLQVTDIAPDLLSKVPDQPSSFHFVLQTVERIPTHLTAFVLLRQQFATPLASGNWHISDASTINRDRRSPRCAADGL